MCGLIIEIWVGGEGFNARTGTVARGCIVVGVSVGLDESGTCFSARKAPMSK